MKHIFLISKTVYHDQGGYEEDFTIVTNEGVRSNLKKAYSFLKDHEGERFPLKTYAYVANQIAIDSTNSYMYTADLSVCYTVCKMPVL